jgi:DNA invertase Pin-like site-specific DNA recombinase
MSKKPLRCAIYTRKSSEEGLEQDFNSLDAQREACAAYVASQKGEGWKLLPEPYDDGGISGGTLKRPALQHLLAEMEAGKIDLIVVYKVDRLTRSLADFAKLVERFDAAGASFVSVTQQFNTATSMGRLTLNVLLSFSQFEREVTAERIRDKIAASKKKGLWMGGLVPLGYEAKERTLVINATEAKTVQKVFQLYLKLGCVRRVKDEADRRGLVSKKHHFETGRSCGGVSLTRGRIYHLLANPIYNGEIRHKQQRYPGQHPAIIDRETFEAVALKLKAKAGRTRGNGSATAPSPLVGKLTDETGDRLTPTHALSHGRRHRYYVSRRLITESGKADLSGWRLPAPALEKALAQTITDALQDPRRVQGLITEATPEILRRLPAALTLLAEKLKGPERGTVLQATVAKGVIEPGRLSIMLSPEAIAESLGVALGQVKREALQIQGRFTLRRRGVEAKLVMGNEADSIDCTLLKTIARGWLWFEEIKAGTTMQAIAKREGITQRRVAHLVDLAFLAPDIVTAIVEGRQPPTLTADRLIKAKHRPFWEAQRALIAAQ